MEDSETWNAMSDVEKKKINLLSNDPSKFLSFPLEEQDNREFVKYLLENRKAIFEYVNDNFKNDKEIVLLAIKNTSCRGGYSAFSVASDELKNDIEFVKEILKCNKNTFGNISENLRANKDLVMYALECKCSNILYYASEELLNDKDVVLNAVKINYGEGLDKVSKILQKDFEILIESAIRSGNSAIRELKRKKLPPINDLEFEQLSQKNKELYIIRYLDIISDFFWDENQYNQRYFISKKVAMAIISCECVKESQYKSIPEIYRNDKEVVMHAIKRNPKLFEFIDDSFKADKEVLDLHQLVINTPYSLQ